MRQSFWSPEARDFLLACDRKDLLDRGDAFAERVTALMLTVISRLNRYAESGDLYNGQGWKDVSEHSDALTEIDHFVNVRLKEEMNALEKILKVFDDLRLPVPSQPVHEEPDVVPSLPYWY